MEWKNVLKTLAPTVAAALGGPLAGGVVALLGDALGVAEPTQQKIAQAIASGQLSGEQVAQIKQLELKLQAEEKERGFKYAELEFKDRDSARKYNTEGGIQSKLFAMSLFLLTVTIGCEIAVLFNGYPTGVPDVLVGRILGLMDSIALMVLAYYYGTSSGSQRKTDLMMIQGAK